MDAQKQEKLKDINRRFEFYQRLEGSGTLYADQYVEDLDFFLQLVREQVAQLEKYEHVVKAAKYWRSLMIDKVGFANDSKERERVHRANHAAAVQLKNAVDALETVM